MKLIAIIGAPATGKSSIMKEIIKQLPMGFNFRYGLLHYSLHGSVAVLGLYNPNDPFPGTDKLSNRVLNDAISFLTKENDEIRTVIFEGDRLANQSMFDAAKNNGLETKIFHMVVDAPILFVRRLERKQNPAWVKGRETKVAKLAKTYQSEPIVNSRPADFKNAVRQVLLEIGNS